MDAATFTARLVEVRAEIDAAAARASRAGADVRLVVVTKASPPSIFATALACGVTDVGENRLPAALDRMAGYERAFRWHFVGHLQSNKARRAVAAFDVFHGIDSADLMERVDRVAADLLRAPELLLQVNVSGEASKAGMRPEELGATLERARTLEAARVIGLMTMAPRVDDVERTRPVFAALRALRDELDPGHERLRELSMGMTEDFAVAVEEGATLVRVGRRLVEPPRP